MILSDRDLRERLERGDIKIDPLLDAGIQIQPASIDLRLGLDFQTFNFTQQALIDPMDPQSFAHSTTLVRLAENESFIVHPGEFILATTLERVEVPTDLVARLEGRSSVGRLGIVILCVFFLCIHCRSHSILACHSRLVQNFRAPDV